MEELPRSSFESADSDTESRSEKKSEKKKTDSSSVRKIGAFAKMTAEAPAATTDRTEARKSFFEDKDTDRVEPSGGEIEATEADADTEAAETADKVEALQEELTVRIEAHQEIIDSTPEDSEEHVKAVAAKGLDEGVKAKADNPAIEANPVIEAEFARQLAEIKLPDEVDASSGNEEMPEVDVIDDAEDEPEDATASAQSVSPPSPPPPPKKPPAQTSSSGGSGGAPPVPPTLPVQPPSRPSLPPIPPLSGGNTPPPTPNVAPNAAATVNPNAAPDSRNERHRRRIHPAAAALVGYAIGRRGGRKRAERRYEPKVKSLTQELDLTKKHLEAREIDLKKAAATMLREQQPEKYVRRPERIEQSKKKPVTEILRQTVMAPEKIQSAIRTTEAELIMPKPTKAELPRQETVVHRPQASAEIAVKRAEQLSTPALLKAAESLIIEGVSVRRMYETNKIDRNGLVAIVQEGLRGGNIVHTFEKVELGAEAQAGRAREFRHDDPSFSALPSDNTTTTPPPQSASSQLPNNPDLKSLQPINIPATAEQNKVESREDTHLKNVATPRKSLLDPKTAEFTFAGIAAIIIALLILWAIF